MASPEEESDDSTITLVRVQVRGYSSPYIHHNARVRCNAHWYVVTDDKGTTRYPARSITYAEETGE